MVFRRQFRKRYRKKSTKAPKAFKRYVKRQISKSVENKYITTYVSGTGVINSGNVFPLITISQGLTDQNRIGDRVTMKRLTFRYNISTGDSTNQVRVIIFQYKAVNFLSLTPSVVLNGSSPTYLSQYNWDGRSQFAVLYDKTHAVNTDLPSRTFVGRAKMKWAKRQIMFQAGSSTVAANSLFLLMISDSSATPHPTIDGEFNFFFTDA